MRTDQPVVALLFALAVAGCASTPAERGPITAATRAASPAPPCDTDTRGADCALPADVRAFLEDRAVCDHFRGEPWPESDSGDDRLRRRELVEGVRVHCAGTDRRLAALRERHVADARVIERLSAFEDIIED